MRGLEMDELAGNDELGYQHDEEEGNEGYVGV